MMRGFTERCLRANFQYSLNINVDFAVVNNMNSNSNEMKLHNFLQKSLDLVISRIMKPESISKAALFETDVKILLFYILLCIFQA